MYKGLERLQSWKFTILEVSVLMGQFISYLALINFLLIFIINFIINF